MQGCQFLPRPYSVKQLGTCTHRVRSRSSRILVGAGAALQASQPTQQQQQHAKDLSVVLLLNENIKRQTGRSLLSREQLLQGMELLDTAGYACLVLDASSSSSSSLDTGVDSTSSHGISSGVVAAIRAVLYANQAARDILESHNHNQQQQQQQQQLKGMLLLVPPVVEELLLLQVNQQPPQLQHRQQHQQPPGAAEQQQQSLRVLRDVNWQLGPQVQQQQQQRLLSIPELLCVPMASPNDAPFGLALLFDSCGWGDGAVGVPGWPRVTPADIPDSAALQAAADAVRQQADAVRELKTTQGLGNKDPAVVAAVAELQSLKQQLARLEGLQEAFANGRQRPLHALLGGSVAEAAGAANDS